MRRISRALETAVLDGCNFHRHVLPSRIDIARSLGASKLRVYIVHAHHEPKSFNGAMTREATAALQAAGHEVAVSDLYAMGFNPVSDRRNFVTVKDPERLRQQTEEAYAAEQNGFAPDIQAEMDKLFWCDVLVLQFPLWWFGLPAILKGWVDRVFASGGRIYGGGKWYDRGVFRGKRAMCALTIGGPPSMYSEAGLNGSISSILFPINHGILYFTGFTVIEPFLVHAPARIGQEARTAELARYRARILGLGSAPTISYPVLDDYDENYVLKTKSP
ncbi:MAG: NAD(P)H-dependent oxidoreductase [Bradyrhizobium sp.]